VDLGELHRLWKHPAKSERYFRVGAMAGRRHGFPQVRGAALHGLFLLSFERGDLDAAEHYARSAARSYGRGHARLPELMHSVAEVWIARGSHARALPVLQRLLPGRHAPLDRARTLALIAHAADGSGERHLYEEAWSKAWASLGARPSPEAGDATAEVLAELARVAAKAGDWERVALARHRYAQSPAAAAADPQLWNEIRRMAAPITPPAPLITPTSART
jgi:hypothetical protein